MSEGALAFGYGNLVDTAVLTGGDWETSQGNGLDKLKVRALAKYARASSSSSADATLIMDHGAPAAAQLFAFFAHNLTDVNASVLIKRSDTLGASDLLYQSELAWKFSPLGGDRDGSYFGIFVVAAAETSARYTEIQLTTNTIAKARLGRPFVGPIFFPSPCAAELVDDWLPSTSLLTRTENQADWVSARTNARSARVAYKYMGKERSSLLSEIVRTHGTTKELVYLPTVESEASLQQYGFLATLRSLPASDVDSNSAMERASVLTFDERGGAP